MMQIGFPFMWPITLVSFVDRGGGCACHFLGYIILYFCRVYAYSKLYKSYFLQKKKKGYIIWILKPNYQPNVDLECYVNLQPNQKLYFYILAINDCTLKSNVPYNSPMVPMIRENARESVTSLLIEPDPR